jgi:hypothetical protein
MVKQKIKKCPPGVFCIENMSILIIFILLAIILYYVYSTYKQGNKSNNNNQVSHQNKVSDIVSLQVPQTMTEESSYFVRPEPGIINTYVEKDILYNPYTPPLKENPFYTMLISPFSRGRGIKQVVGGAVPINIPTSHYDLSYKQTGILTKPNSNGDSTILPLFGRPLHSNRNKWQYYTMSDKNNMVKLPVSKGGRSCTDQVVGCDELYNGDNVYVECYGDVFNVTVYENEQPRYIPYV